MTGSRDRASEFPVDLDAATVLLVDGIMQLMLATKYALTLAARRGAQPSSVRSACDTLGVPKKYLTPGHVADPEVLT